jgi:thiol-disulfide isomerase/thioredoxin
MNYKILGGVLLIIVIIIIFLNRDLKEKFEDTKKITIHLYKAQWCGHCKVFLPIFEDFKRKIEKEELSVSIKIIDADDKETQKLMEDNGIEGFPTVLFIKGTNKIKYEGERTVDGLMKMTKSLLNQS